MQSPERTQLTCTTYHQCRPTVAIVYFTKETHWIVPKHYYSTHLRWIFFIS